MEVFLKVLGLTEVRDDVSKLLRLVRSFRDEWRLGMVKASEQIAAVTAKVDDLVADFTAFKEAKERSADEFSPEVQQAFDVLAQRVDALDASVGDADGSDTPVGTGAEGAAEGGAEGDAGFAR